MKALIIGAAGFVGGYLTKELIASGYETFVTKLPHESFDIPSAGIFDTDINDRKALKNALIASSPDVIFHLAAQSSVKVSWEKPDLTMKINVLGTVNLLEVCRELYQNKKSPRILLIGSSEEYGKVSPDDCPIKEETVCRPSNIYAASKLTQGQLGRIYHDAYGIDAVIVRAFNHTGPLQSTTFVTADFCKQAALIAKGESRPIITVGNLEAKRDFTDVRDIVKAYILLAKKGKAGEIYNVGSGRATSIRELLEIIIKCSGVKIEVETDPKRMRPSDTPLHYADISKIKSDTGWSPEISLEQTVSDMIKYFMN